MYPESHAPNVFHMGRSSASCGLKLRLFWKFGDNAAVRRPTRGGSQGLFCKISSPLHAPHAKHAAQQSSSGSTHQVPRRAETRPARRACRARPVRRCTSKMRPSTTIAAPQPNLGLWNATLLQTLPSRCGPTPLACSAAMTWRSHGDTECGPRFIPGRDEIPTS